MLYNIYQIFIIYRMILHIHGAYVAYSFICWSFSTSYTYMAYMLSFFYITQLEPVEQIKDKERNILDELD